MHTRRHQAASGGTGRHQAAPGGTRRHPGGTQAAPGGTQAAPRRHQAAPRRHQAQANAASQPIDLASHTFGSPLWGAPLAIYLLAATADWLLYTFTVTALWDVSIAMLLIHSKYHGSKYIHCFITNFMMQWQKYVLSFGSKGHKQSIHESDQSHKLGWTRNIWWA